MDRSQETLRAYVQPPSRWIGATPIISATWAAMTSCASRARSCRSALRRSASLHPKAWEREKTQGANGQRDQAAEKAAEEKRAAQAREESRLRIAVASKALESITSVPAEALRALAISAAPSWNIRLKLAEVFVAWVCKNVENRKGRQRGVCQGGCDRFARQVRRQ